MASALFKQEGVSSLGAMSIYLTGNNMATTLGGEKEIEKIQDTIEQYLVNIIGLSIEDIIEKELVKQDLIL